MAGFKYKKFSFTGGTTEFPSGTSASDIQTKEKAIVKGFADALIAMNIGWGCDTTRNATTSDFVDVPKYSSSTPAPGLFLVNSTSGCKLFIAYLGMSGDNAAQEAYNAMALYDSDGTTKILPPDLYTSSLFDIDFIDADKAVLGGLVMSMIPDGSTNSFGSTFKASEFLPTDATRLCGSICLRYGIYSISSAVSNVSNGTNYQFSAFATPYCVGYGCGSSSAIHYFCGRIIGSLSNPTLDTSSQSKYGAIYRCVTWKYNTQCTELSPFGIEGSQSIASLPGTSTYSTQFWGQPIGIACPAVNARVNNWVGNHICDAGGNWITPNSVRGVSVVMSADTKCDGTFDNTSNNRPWTPIKVFVFSTDPQNNCVYNGNGFKGYLDTDLFRCSPQFAGGTVMDNGNFVCTGVCCLTLGWDPSNESW